MSKFVKYVWAITALVLFIIVSDKFVNPIHLMIAAAMAIVAAFPLPITIQLLLSNLMDPFSG